MTIRRAVRRAPVMVMALALGLLFVVPQALAEDDALSRVIMTPELGSPSASDKNTLFQLAPRTSWSEDQLIQKLVGPLKSVALGKLSDFTDAQASRHKRYSVLWEGIPVAGAYVVIHAKGSQVTLMNAMLPRALPFDPTVLYGLTPFAELIAKAGLRRDLVKEVELVLAPGPEGLKPGWSLKVIDATGQAVAMIVDAVTGKVLAEEALTFDLASALVFAKNSGESAPVERLLEQLDGKGFLNSRYVAVYGGDTLSERAFNEASEYRYRPDTEPLLFDQAQSYFSALRAQDWFKQKMGYEAPPLPVSIYTNANIGNNARYRPEIAGLAAQIQLGKGAPQGLVNLSRDSDVIIHELAHHVLYQYLKTARGETGILHEGFADYFAYAINGDPNLGETIVPGGAFLRTANLGPGPLYDDPNQARTSHQGGAHWAALLWQLRRQFGEGIDTLVYRSLAYMPPDASIQDAFIALIEADRAQVIAPSEYVDSSQRAAKKCDIIRAGLERGFSAALADLDGSDCGLDLKASHESRLLDLGIVASKKRQLKVMGASCGVALNGRNTAQSWSGLAILSLFIPIISAAFGCLRARVARWR